MGKEGRKEPAPTQLHVVCPGSWVISSPGLICDFLVAIPPWIERGAGGLLCPTVSGPSHAEQAGGWGGFSGHWLGTMCSGVLPGMQCCWLGLLGVTASLPSHLASPYPIAFIISYLIWITSYPAGFGGHGALLVDPSEQLSGHQMPATSRGVPGGHECGHAGWGQDGDGGLCCRACPCPCTAPWPEQALAGRDVAAD